MQGPVSRHLDDGVLKNQAPAIFAEAPHERTSEAYSFVPTIEILNLLRDEGWMPVSARQSRVMNESKEGFQKHIVRLRQAKDIRTLSVDELIPEVVITNGHDGNTPYSLHAGLMRCFCDNQCVVGDSTFNQIKVNHIGFDPKDIIEASYRIIQEIPALTDSVDDWRQTKLSDDHRVALAKAALRLRWEEDKNPVDEHDLLQYRRRSDKEHDLWTTFNVIQENLIRGGMSLDKKTRRNYGAKKVKDIQSIDKEISINKNLWDLSAHLKQVA